MHVFVADGALIIDLMAFCSNSTSRMSPFPKFTPIKVKAPPTYFRDSRFYIKKCTNRILFMSVISSGAKVSSELMKLTNNFGKVPWRYWAIR